MYLVRLNTGDVCDDIDDALFNAVGHFLPP
jgi:hypothetical protein